MIEVKNIYKTFYVPHEIKALVDVSNKIEEQFQSLKNHHYAQYFTEITDSLFVDERYYEQKDKVMEGLNKQLRTANYKDMAQNIGVIYCGKQSPGGNNICDGLLRFQA